MTNEGFSSIRVTTLRGDLRIPFDVYVKIDGKQVLYCHQGDSFEGERLERLKAKRIKKMYIRPDDNLKYRQYLNASLDTAYNPKSAKSIALRAEVIQGFQQAAAENYMDDPLDQVAYKYARSSAQRFIEFLKHEPDAARAILAIPNVDMSVTHHGVNVAVLSLLMVKESQLHEGLPLHILVVGCLIHDIEHYCSEFDLSRPASAYSEDEHMTYNAHPLLGAERLQGASFVDRLVLNIIAQHEEHADGSGFPKKLMERNIDPCVLFVAAANAFDRLTSQEKLSAKDALKKLLIDKMGAYPLTHLQQLQKLLKQLQIV